MRRRLRLAAVALGFGVTLWWWQGAPRDGVELRQTLRGATVRQRVAEVRPAALRRLQPRLTAAQVAWPPRRVVLVGLKAERRLRLYAGDEHQLRWVHTYPILAASGRAGPKLAYGDGQVPEGRYDVESVHPNSRYHLALRLNYLNAEDRELAAAEGRRELGSDIMIHGGAVSVGCLAMGDAAIEELFVLAAAVGPRQVAVVLAPCDLLQATAEVAQPPAWLPRRYEAIRRELRALPPLPPAAAVLEPTL